MSLEHIYPEKPDSKWKKLKNVNLVKNIGNLVLLDSGLNSEVGNKEFKLKKDIIVKKSTLISSKRIVEKKSEWGDNEIIERRNSLVDILYKEIWE